MGVRAAWALLIGSAALVGCSAVLGLTPGSPLDGDGDGGDLGDATVDSPATCGPCVGANTTAFTCAGSACVVAACAAGLGDCDKDPTNGCETDTTTGAHCGSCTQVCPATTPICSGSSCIGADACDGSVCGTSCVDTTSSVHHCGSCAKDCTVGQPTNTSADCSGSVCRFSCAGGASDCNHDLQTPSSDGCECTSGCNGNVCCPVGGCGQVDAGPDSGDSAPPPFDAGNDTGADAGGCKVGGACVSPLGGCSLGSSSCCCPGICQNTLAPVPWSSPGEAIPSGIPDATIGAQCCIPPGTTFFGACSPNPCCGGGGCMEGGSASKCL